MRLEAKDSTEETNSTVPDLVYMMKDNYIAKSILELTSTGKVLLFAPYVKQKCGEISKYEFDIKHKKKDINQLKAFSTPLSAMMGQTVLVDDISKLKTTFFTPKHKVKLDNFTGEPKTDTPRFHVSKTDLDLKSVSHFSEHESPSKQITLSDIMKHNKAGDMWAIFDGKVFDISNYVSRHPELLTGFKDCSGKDAKSVFSIVQPHKKGSVFFKSELLGEMY